MNHVLTNSTVPVENMIGIALILVAVAVKGIRILSKRLSQYRLTLQTESFDLTMQTKPHSLPQESLQLEQPGVDENDRSTNDNGRIPSTDKRPQF